MFSHAQQVDNSAVLTCQDFTTMDGKDFHDVEKEKDSLKVKVTTSEGEKNEHRFKGDGFCITDGMKQDYHEDGYVLIRGLFTNAEVSHIERALNEERFAVNTYGVPDGDGKEAHLILWNNPGVDVTGMVSRCEKVAGSCEELLGGEVYHYHTKLMKKPAQIGGKHVWHQDYGYWYNYGCLFPDMMTVFIAVDKCTKANSCLQVLRGSHKCGRIEHVRVGGQVGADTDRVAEIAKVCPLQYVEMGPGDALFFHCNLLHCSSANTSMDRRWAFLCAYNKASNDPIYDSHNAKYTKLEKVTNDMILKCNDFTTMEGKMFQDMGKVTKTGRRIRLEEQNQ